MVIITTIIIVLIIEISKDESNIFLTLENVIDEIFLIGFRFFYLKTLAFIR